METNANMNKRKKRKTRKCLDEIRKRARRSFENDISKVCNISNCTKISNCILTNKRLTLSMFPKAVRSETITRPALVDLEPSHNLNFQDFLKNKMIGKMNIHRTRLSGHNINRSIKHINEADIDLVSNRRPSEESYNYEDSSNKHVNNCEVKLTENSDLFTSLDSNEITDKSPNSIGAQSVSTLTTSSNQSLHDDCGYNLYEEFMSEIPMYLKRNATFIEEDVMKKTKMFLQNLFVESCYQECEDNVIKCINNNNTKESYYTNREIIVHNPMDYIRLSHNMQENQIFHQFSRTGAISENCSTPHSPLPAPSSPAVSSDSPLSVIVHDTPDYAYYPHRLN